MRLQTTCYICVFFLVVTCKKKREVQGSGKRNVKIDNLIQKMCRSVLPRFYEYPGAEKMNTTPVHHAITQWETNRKLRIIIRGNTGDDTVRAVMVQVRHQNLPRPRFVDPGTFVLFDCKPFTKNMVYAIPRVLTTNVTMHWILPDVLPADKLYLHFTPIRTLPTYWVLSQPIPAPPGYAPYPKPYVENYYWTSIIHTYCKHNRFLFSKFIKSICNLTVFWLTY